MSNSKKILVLLTSLSIGATLSGVDTTWIAETPNNDMEVTSHWSGSAVPGSGDTAIFDSTIASISTNPTEETNTFSVLNFQFSHAASPFVFTFNKQTLEFAGFGITGSQTNTTINAINTDNTSSVANQILFSGSNNTIGSAAINVSNIGSVYEAGQVINAQIHSIGSFAVQDNGSLSVSSQATLSNPSQTYGGDITASQILFDSTVTVADSVTFSAMNSGTLTGTATTAGSSVGRVYDHQLSVGGRFEAGDNLILSVANSGINDSTGVGDNHVGWVANGSQIEFGSLCTVGDNAQINVSNSGSNSGDGTSTNYVGSVVEQQFHVVGGFQAGDSLTLTATNTGFDDSTGNGAHDVASISSNSGLDGRQIQFDALCTVGNNASITAENSGTYEGTNTVRGSIIASLNRGQILFQNNFSALDHLSISASNTGVDSAVGVGNDVVGALSAEQVRFNAACAIGDYGAISVSNSGNYSGQNSTTYNSVGGMPGSQFHCEGSFQAGDSFNLAAENIGVDSSQGIGSNFIASVANGGGNQVRFNNTSVLGDDANITITNRATNSGESSIGGGQLASFINGGQFHAEGQFQAGNNFTFQVENTANDSGTSTGGLNYIGSAEKSNILFNAGCQLGDHASISMINSGSYTGTNTVQGNRVASNANGQFSIQEALSAGDYFSLNLANTAFDSSQGNGNNYIGSMTYQAEFLGGISLGDHATITTTNAATYTGSNIANPNSVGIINTHQFYSPENMIAGNHFNLRISNRGDCNTSGSGNTVGSVATSQFLLNADCQLGNDATLLIENLGKNGGTGTTNTVGWLGNSQFLLNGNFTAGSNLNLSLSNQAINEGDGNNDIGYIGSTQLAFKNNVTLGDGCSLSVYNSGNHSGITSLTNTPLGAVNSQLYVVGQFTTGNAFSLNVINSASDSSQGFGGNSVASVVDQVQFNDRCSFGHQASLYVSNEGIYSGYNSTTSSVVGSIGAPQLTFFKEVAAGDQFTLTVRNSGDCHTAGAGNEVGSIMGAQFNATTGLILGNEATFLIENRGVNQGENSGSLVGDIGDSQFLQNENFIAGSNSKVAVTNFGVNSGGNNNAVSSINGSQLDFQNGMEVGGESLFFISNKNSHTGSETSTGNSVGLLTTQLVVAEAFTAGADFTLGINNTSTANTEGQNNLVGNLANSQLNLLGDSTFGNHSSLFIENNANFDGTGTLNTIGCINSSQAVIHGDYITGSDSIFSVSNYAKNLGNSNNLVGVVSGSQLLFEGVATIGKGSLLSVYNDGTIANSQMLFNEGFELLSGKAKFVAWNEGSVGDYGIEILGSRSGGNVNVTLGNTSLHINTPTPTFTIGELNGDSRATVQSRPTFIIDTDKDTQGNFAGNIQDFPSIASTLIKRGLGSQELSGNNSYTGLTTVEEGSLILTGRVAADVDVNSEGILKGTGSVGGKLLNKGTIAPGLSIGTLTVEGDFVNDHGKYELEINTRGESDLLVVNGTATLNGGVVEVLPEEPLFLFQHPYTILTAAKIKGRFSKARGSPSPLMLTNLKYDSKHVYLILQQDISKAAQTDNQKGVATQLDGIKDPGMNQNILLNEMVRLSFPEVRDALDTLSGYQHTDDIWTMQMVSRQFIRRLYNPLRPLVTLTYKSDCDECIRDWTCWMEAEGGVASLKGNENSSHLQMHHYEMTTGFQKTVFRNLTVGFAGSYEYDQMHYRDGGSGKNSNYLAALYGLYRPSSFYALVDFAYGYSSNAINRSIEVGLLKYTARSKPIISQFDFYGELGVDLFIHAFLIQPFAGIQTGNYWRNHVKEHDASDWGLTIDKKDWTTTTSRLGLHLSTQCQDGEFSLDLSWNKLLAHRKNKIKGRFTDFGHEYTIVGIPLDSNSIDYALTFSQSFDGGLNGYLEFSGESWKSASNYSFIGGINFEW